MLTRVFPDQCYIQCVQFNPDGQFVGKLTMNQYHNVLYDSLVDQTFSSRD